MILTASGRAYKGIDGIYVVPINLLRNKNIGNNLNFCFIYDIINKSLINYLR